MENMYKIKKNAEHISQLIDLTTEFIKRIDDLTERIEELEKES